MTFGILALGFPVSQDLGAFGGFPVSQDLGAFGGFPVSQDLGVSQPLGAHSLTFFLIFPILMHSLGDVWHPGSGVPCFGGFGGFAAFGGSQSHFLPYLPYLNAFLR